MDLVNKVTMYILFINGTCITFSNTPEKVYSYMEIFIVEPLSLVLSKKLDFRLISSRIRSTSTLVFFSNNGSTLLEVWCAKS